MKHKILAAAVGALLLASPIRAFAAVAGPAQFLPPGSEPANAIPISTNGAFDYTYSFEPPVDVYFSLTVGVGGTLDINASIAPTSAIDFYQFNIYNPSGYLLAYAGLNASDNDSKSFSFTNAAAGSYIVQLSGTGADPVLTLSGQGVSPVPLPGALALFGFACAGLAGFGLRKARRAASV